MKRHKPSHNKGQETEQSEQQQKKGGKQMEQRDRQEIQPKKASDRPRLPKLSLPPSSTFEFSFSSFSINQIDSHVAKKRRSCPI